ncbi:cytosolic protein [Thiocapsa imhoffii]|uniref:Cytosolic protein n=1 Tax=Thiocapsa imhoffii TaxID=382777 RepID=A0A9X0WM29_9GAMM|nr:cytosolic protein [Thiocapsa imhoffii]MBK1646963.1 cytosolic protein [Thiocapsa imhoffii]
MRTPATATRDDDDSPWKDLLDRWQRPFLEFFFPAIAADIDWSRGFEFLDKELQTITRRAVVGRRYVDKLVKVWRWGGEETWVLIHTEVQGEPDPAFARRLYTYHSRLMDRYDRPVATLVILADERPGWRPQRYRHTLWGCEVVLVFPVVKLLDFKSRMAELEASANPFALVVLAQLAATATKRDPAARLDRKIGLTRRLYRCGLSRDEVLSLYAFIDWVMRLPEPLEDDYHRAIQAIEEAEQMRYVTTAERIGMRKGMERGMKRGLESERTLLQRQARRRFGDDVAERAAVLLARIQAPETLEQLGEALLDDADGEVWLTAVQAQVDGADDRKGAGGAASPAG